MKEKIRAYVEQLFEEAPRTRKAYELKEEMVSNLSEKFDDLVVGGKGEEEAFNLVVSGIGDLSELIQSLEESVVLDPVLEQKARKKSALMVSIAVMLYILSIVVLILSLETFNLDAGIAVSLMFLIAGAATVLLIYNGMSQPRYRKMDDSVVEEFKEWKSSKDKNTSIRKSISSALWTLTVALYLIISFVFDIWYISWIIFIIAAAVEQIIKAYYEVKR